MLSLKHVSRRHALIRRDLDNRIVIKNTSAEHVILINGQRLEGERELIDGDRIAIGCALITAEIPRQENGSRAQNIRNESPDQIASASILHDLKMRSGTINLILCLSCIVLVAAIVTLVWLLSS